MFRWLFGPPAPQGPVRLSDALDTEPGAEVRTDEGVTGTLTALFELDGRPWARVVFCGHNTSWVELMDASRLELAMPIAA